MAATLKEAFCPAVALIGVASMIEGGTAVAVTESVAVLLVTVPAVCSPPP